MQRPAFRFARFDDVRAQALGGSLVGSVVDETGAALDNMGHKVSWWREWEWKAGSVCAIVRDQASGMMEGGADVRRPGGVRGW